MILTEDVGDDGCTWMVRLRLELPARLTGPSATFMRLMKQIMYRIAVAGDYQTIIPKP